MKFSVALQLALLISWTNCNESFNLFGVNQFTQRTFVRSSAESDQDKTPLPHPPDGPPPETLLGENLHFASPESNNAEPEEEDKDEESKTDEKVTADASSDEKPSEEKEEDQELFTDATREKTVEIATIAGQKLSEVMVSSFVFKHSYYNVFGGLCFLHLTILIHIETNGRGTDSTSCSERYYQRSCSSWSSLGLSC